MPQFLLNDLNLTIYYNILVRCIQSVNLFKAWQNLMKFYVVFYMLYCYYYLFSKYNNAKSDNSKKKYIYEIKNERIYALYGSMH